MSSGEESALSITTATLNAVDLITSWLVIQLLLYKLEVPLSHNAIKLFISQIIMLLQTKAVYLYDRCKML